MSSTAEPAAGDPSPRVRLAEAAAASALSVPGVVSLDAGPARLFVTAGGGRQVSGVTCAAAPEGGFDVALRLVCRLVPLPALTEQVRAGVERAAASAGIEVATIAVTVADIVENPDAAAVS